MTVKIDRSKVVDLIIACSVISGTFEEGTPSYNKWKNIHDELMEQLHKFDEKNLNK